MGGGPCCLGLATRSRSERVVRLLIFAVGLLSIIQFLSIVAFGPDAVPPAPSDAPRVPERKTTPVRPRTPARRKFDILFRRNQEFAVSTAAGGGREEHERHPNFPQGFPVPRPFLVDPGRFSDRQRQVVRGIQHAFASYAKYAWGHDEHMVLAKGFTNWGDEGTKKVPHGIALTLIEMLDTLWLAGLEDEFNASVAHLESSEHSFDRNVDVSLFETTIRVLGGLLAAYELSGRLVLLDKAHDIGERLFHAVTSRSIPHAMVNLHTGRAYSPQWLSGLQSLAEVTTIQMEFCKLSQHQGIMDFCEGALAVMHTVLQHTPPSGLFPIYIHTTDGTPDAEKPVTLGARGDSFYEYLAKQWVLTNKTEKWLQLAYEKTSNGIIEKLLKQMDESHAFIAEANEADAINLEYKMDHLVCFVVGMLQIAKHGVTEARDDKAAGDIARTCHNMYISNPTGLGVEIVRFREANGVYEMYPSEGAFHYIMRPEAIEAMFYQTRYHPEEYETWSNMAWVMYEAMEKQLWVEDGWTGLNDATTLGGGRTDKMESFFVAETLKYAFLAVADKKFAPTQLPLADWVFNTEAHPLRVMPGPLLFVEEKQ